MNRGPDLRKRLLISFAMFIGVIVAGSLGFWAVGGGEYSLFDSLYMTVITVSTVGYGEVLDLSGNPEGRAFAMFIILAGMGIIVYFVSNITAFLVEGELKELFWRKKMDKLLKGMRDHYIVCGAGAMGMHVINEFQRTGRRTVAVDSDAQRIEALGRTFQGLGLVVGDASENDVLKEARIESAFGLVVASDNDKDNLVITMSARQLNPSLRIVVRCLDINHLEKFQRAGADSVVSSNFIGGLRMASEMVRPKVTTFLDRMLRDEDKVLRIEEVTLKSDSSMTGKAVSEFRRLALVLAVYTSRNECVFNPKDDYVLNAGETVVFMGTPEDRQHFMGSAAQ